MNVNQDNPPQYHNEGQNYATVSTGREKGLEKIQHPVMGKTVTAWLCPVCILKFSRPTFLKDPRDSSLTCRRTEALPSLQAWAGLFPVWACRSLLSGDKDQPGKL